MYGYPTDFGLSWPILVFFDGSGDLARGLISKLGLVVDLVVRQNFRALGVRIHHDAP